MLLFRITQYGLTGNAAAVIGDNPYNLLLHGATYQGLNQQIFVSAHASVAAAKTAAVAIAKATLAWTDEVAKDGTTVIGSHSAAFTA